MDMACAGELTSLRRLRAYVAAHAHRRRMWRMLWCLSQADEHSASPPETAMRLVWCLDGRWPRPLCNRPVYALDGAFIAVPDLFDPVLGVAGERDGALHRSRSRHRADVARLERCTAAGIERFTVVAGDSREVTLARMRATRHRAAQRTGPPRGRSSRHPGRGPPTTSVSRSTPG